MAAPGLNLAKTGVGATDAGGAWSYTCAAPAAAGRVIIFQVVQDGSSTGVVAVTGSTNINNLAGSAGWTTVASEQAVGSPTSALQSIFIGRSTSTTAPTISGTNSTSQDLYMRSYEFDANVSSGTTLATVIENGSAGATANGAGTSGTASDTAVTTLGPDRLALNFLACDDDVTTGNLPFDGETGGNWVWLDTYAESSGTDGSLTLMYCTMATAGTIDGGSVSLSLSAGWGCIGFALIGTTVVLDQQHYRFRNDDGNETTATWLADLDTDVN